MQFIGIIIGASINTYFSCLFLPVFSLVLSYFPLYKGR